MYTYTKFNDIRSEMLTEAVKNGKKLAEQIAKESGAKLGSLRQVNQGQFQIFGKTTAREYDQEYSPEKVIRIVSTLQFDIR